MYNIQRNKFFPLPDYDLGKHSVKVTIIGKILDTKYAVKLAQMPNLSLHEIILLDKVSKSKSMTEFEIKELKDKQLIEGRKPNFHISAEVAIATGEKSDYLKQRGIDDGYCQKMILNYLEKFGEGKREDFESLLLDKLPDVLDIIQKRNKIKNNLQTLRKQGKIDIKGKIWKMSKPE
jgi:ATP-dependent DNA helicase RecG